MRRRLYFILPDVPSAEQTVRDLLLAHIETRHIHCLAKRGTALGELPEAGILQKTDLVHGAEIGLAWGGLIGIVGGTLVVNFPPAGMSLQWVAVLLFAIGGAAFGAWAAAMAGASVPNSQLATFYSAIEAGAILLMVDVPFSRAEELRNLIQKRHPEAIPGGTEPTIPAFP